MCYSAAPSHASGASTLRTSHTLIRRAAPRNAQKNWDAIDSCVLRCAAGSKAETELAYVETVGEPSQDILRKLAGLEMDETQMIKDAADIRTHRLDYEVALDVDSWELDSELQGKLNSTTPTEGLRKYYKCAKECQSERTWLLEGSESHGAINGALAALKKCGIVHLRSVLDEKLLGGLQRAWAELSAGNFEGFALNTLADTSHLRAGRTEVWLPYVLPFNDMRLLREHRLSSIIRSYLGTSEWQINYATVIVAHHSRFQRQKLHSDVGIGNQHLELHIALEDVVEELGPTRFCPCTQNTAEPSAAAQAVNSYFGLKGHCADFKDLRYMRPVKAGEITIYDASVIHQGMANRHTGKIDRPVLALSIAVSKHAIVERNYTGTSTIASKSQLILGEVAKFQAHREFEPESRGGEL